MFIRFINSSVLPISMAFPKRSHGSGAKKGGKAYGGRKSYDRAGDRGDFGGGGFQKHEMYRATCAKCGQSCEVPFRPNGSKPVYCSNCFKRDDDRSSDGPSYGRKPSYNRSARTVPDAGSAGMTKEQFRILNEKLDTIIEALSGRDEHGD